MLRANPENMLACHGLQVSASRTSNTILHIAYPSRGKWARPTVLGRKPRPRNSIVTTTPIHVTRQYTYSLLPHCFPPLLPHQSSTHKQAPQVSHHDHIAHPKSTQRLKPPTLCRHTQSSQSQLPNQKLHPQWPTTATPATSLRHCPWRTSHPGCGPRW